MSASPAFEPSAPLRLITPRRSLPGSRAIAGGVLIAVAVIGTYVAATGASKDHLQPVVVASHDLAPGARIQASDLSIVRMQLAPASAAHVAATRERLVGTTLLGPVEQGEIVQTGDLVTKQSDAQHVELSFALPASRALDGHLRAGETVDVLTTDKTTTTAIARTAVAGATVVGVDSAAGGGIGKNGDTTITLSVGSSTDAAAIAGAVDQGQITLVRSTGTAEQAPLQ